MLKKDVEIMDNYINWDITSKEAVHAWDRIKTALSESAKASGNNGQPADELPKSCLHVFIKTANANKVKCIKCGNIYTYLA